jgi:hypothetical protein
MAVVVPIVFVEVDVDDTNLGAEQVDKPQVVIAGGSAKVGVSQV